VAAEAWYGATIVPGMPQELSNEQRQKLQSKLALVQELLTLPTVKKHETRFKNEVALVAAKSDLLAVADMVASHLGEAVKPAHGNLPAQLQASPLVAAMGGVRDNQTLYLEALGAGLSIYVAFWPWGGGSRFTIKVGVYEG
jgi:hypothetical protein